MIVLNINSMFRSVIGEPQVSEAKVMELKPGQVVRGVVQQDLGNQEAIISINGVQVRAKLEAPLQQGEGTMLQVQGESTSGQIILKPVAISGGGSSDVAFADMLKSFGLKDSSVNRELILQMQSAGVPLTKENVDKFAEMLAAKPANIEVKPWIQAMAVANARGLPMSPGVLQALTEVMVDGNPLTDRLAGLEKEIKAVLQSQGTNLTEQTRAGLGKVLQILQQLSQLGPDQGNQSANDGKRPLAGNGSAGSVTVDGSTQATVGKPATTVAGSGFLGAQGQLTAQSAGTSTQPAGTVGTPNGTTVGGTAGTTTGVAGMSAGTTGGATGSQPTGITSGAGTVTISGTTAGSTASQSAGTTTQAAVSSASSAAGNGTPASQIAAQASLSAADAAAGGNSGRSPQVAAAPAGAASSAPAQAATVATPVASSAASATPGGASTASGPPSGTAAQAAAQANAAATPPAPAGQSAAQAVASANPAAISESNGGWIGSAFKLLGVDHEQLLAKSTHTNPNMQAIANTLMKADAAAIDFVRQGREFLQNPNPVEVAQQLPGDSLKSLLLALSKSDDLPPVLKDAMANTAQQITGQQLLLSAERNSPLTHLTLFIPFTNGDGQQTASVHIQSRKKGRESLDPSNCRLLFDLQLQAMGDTLVDVQVINSIVSLQVHNDHPIIPQLLEASREEIATGLQAMGYQFMSMQCKPFPDHSKQKEMKSSNLLDGSKDPQSFYQPKPYKGVDLRA